MSGWVGVRCTRVRGRVRVPKEGSGLCGRLRLRQSNDISLTTCNTLPPSRLSLLSALFSSAELNVLVTKRAIKFGRSCRQKRKDVQYTQCCAICPQPHILMSVLSYPGINICHDARYFLFFQWIIYAKITFWMTCLTNKMHTLLWEPLMWICQLGLVSIVKSWCGMTVVFSWFKRLHYSKVKSCYELDRLLYLFLYLPRPICSL